MASWERRSGERTDPSFGLGGDQYQERMSSQLAAPLTARLVDGPRGWLGLTYYGGVTTNCRQTWRAGPTKRGFFARSRRRTLVIAVV